MDNQWKRLNRESVYDSKFLKVYNDTVELPDGKVIDGYTVIEKPSIVMVVATTIDDRVIILNEYKYAAGKRLLTLPAGHKKESESAIEAARRELLEETGYTSDGFKDVCTLYDYPTKDLHKVYVVRVNNAEKTTKQNLEGTESISYKTISLEELKG